MPLASLALLLVAAVFHALANLLLKQARDKLAFTWWILGVSSVLGIPLLFTLSRIDPAGWLLVAISGVLEAAYFIALGRAYSLGDLSQVYPIARGSAPLFTTVWAFLFLSERPSPLGVIGIASIVAGLYLVNLPSLADWKRPLLGFKHSAARWALLTGVLISGYSTVDKQGSAYLVSAYAGMGSSAAKLLGSIMYLYLVLFVGWIVQSFQWLSAGRRAALFAEVKPETGLVYRSTLSTGSLRRTAGRLISIAAGALLGFAAYVLVLTALQLSPVSYVSPTREVSVVIGTWIGVKYLSERGGAVRVVASCLVAGGILLIAFGG